MFENAEITIEDLPQAEAVEWQSMDPRFVRRKLTGSVLGIASVLVAVTVLQYILAAAFEDTGLGRSFGWLWLLPVIVAVPSLVWPLISVPKVAYAIRDKDIIYKSGVFWRTVTAIPFNRIQHVEKSSTPLDRRFHIATLQLFTAGGSGGDLNIHGLSTRTAEKLRTFILDRVGSSIEQA
ncbi:MAG: PH domain-containing protein [Gammaproteobacteria bacterium]|nr:PH domain-containing protein [Gammaproteobacteria bacterium]